MIWFALAIVAGLILGKLMGFMTVEFVLRPLVLLVRCGLALFGAIVSWGRHLP